MKLISLRSLRRRSLRGMTLVELLVAMGISGVVMVALASLIFYSARSFAALTNYVELDHFSRRALDTMTKDIRQADRLDYFSTNKIRFIVPGGTLTYTYDAEQKKLFRERSDEKDMTLLEECDFMQFSIYQRNPIAGSYDQYAVATPGTCKVVQLHWICSREILGKKANTESVQSAKIVIRRQ